MRTNILNLKGNEFYYRDSPSSDLPVVNQIFNLGAYDFRSWKHYEILNKYRNENIGGDRALIIDAGANIGASSIFFADYWENSTVLAIEPERKNFALLKINTLQKEIKAVEGAIGSESGIMYLKDPGNGDVGYRVDTNGEYEVNVVSVNDLILKYNKLKPFVIKIDIEGGEDELFSKNTEWIDQFPLLIIELHDWMLPLKQSSNNFQKCILNKNFEILQKGENLFCFNVDLLKGNK